MACDIKIGQTRTTAEVRRPLAGPSCEGRGQNAHIDRQPRASLGGELQPGEQLLWSGKPGSTRSFTHCDAFLVPFGLVWSGIALVGAVNALPFVAPAGGLFCVLFVLVGIYMAFGRLIVRAWVRERTVYEVTNRRLLAHRPGWRGACHTSSVWLASHPPLEKRIGRDGQGTLWVGRHNSPQQTVDDDWGWVPSSSSLVAFLDIPEANGVASLIARQLCELGS
jgi:hypothetical protein